MAGPFSLPFGGGGGAGGDPGSIDYKGSLDATLAANLPASPSDGDMYRVSVAGSFEDDASIFPASTYFDIGDALFWADNVSLWQKIESDDHMEPNSEVGTTIAMTVFTTAPVAPVNGTMWFRFEGGQMFIERRESGTTYSVELG